MKNKKIAFISEHASPLATLGGVDSGGQNVYVAEVAKHLVKEGHEVDVFTRWDDPKLPMIFEWLPGLRVIHMEAGPIAEVPKEMLLQYMPDFRDSMIEFMRDYNITYDVIHAHFWMSGLVAAQIKERYDIPFVITFHALGKVRRIFQGDNDKFPAERMAIEEEVIKFADQIIAECPQDQEDLVLLYNAPLEKTTIIPCGFCPQEFYPIDKLFARRILNLHPEEKVLLQLGRMVPRKGVDNVIKALAKLKYDDAPVRLLVVGGESDAPDPLLCPELGRLQELALKEGVADKVEFTGRRKRSSLKFFYSAADLFITTPWYEPFGITPLEAMACGTPTIGANVGGIKYSIADGETGFLVPPNNPDALASRVSQLLSAPQLMEEMKYNSLKRVNSHFTWASITRSLEEVYANILFHNNSLAFEVPYKRTA